MYGLPLLFYRQITMTLKTLKGFVKGTFKQYSKFLYVKLLKSQYTSLSSFLFSRKNLVGYPAFLLRIILLQLSCSAWKHSIQLGKLS